MAYVLNIYYIGPMSRYDGTGNTDVAHTCLFSKKDTAINYAIEFINDATNDEIDPKDPYVQTLKNDLSMGTCNYGDIYMATLEWIEFTT